ncbi:hypothetical protein BDA96_01G576000 [Sorghum bicolor]|uniref:Uncharacterized protein n=2 Tax=Sorghum bicolor TaxID=4558 RepID=A0A921S8A6_SORBI|nr:hypothetical protein BDA96_01G576000 [Sorghum bicolor]KXG40397.1 hypothetical protein SORBI_3001G539300 [Sorghum bicolor]
MGDRREARPTFGDISNTIGRKRADETNEEKIKREDRNRKQREYRAHKRAQETSEQREEQNRKQCEYRAMIRATAVANTPGQENIDPTDSMDWLHRNDQYVRKQRPPLAPL